VAKVSGLRGRGGEWALKKVLTCFISGGVCRILGGFVAFFGLFSTEELKNTEKKPVFNKSIGVHQNKYGFFLGPFPCPIVY
jgi:hypothetical protein